MVQQHNKHYDITLKDVLKKREITQEIVFSSDELHDIIEEFSLIDIPQLSTNIKLYPIADDKGIGFEATIDARVTHPCCITLNPIEQKIHEKVILRFLPEDVGDDGNINVDHIYLEENASTFYDHDILVDQKINIFDLAREHLILSFDPLPKEKNAEFKGYICGDVSPEEKEYILNMNKTQKNHAVHKPFDVLEMLKEKLT